MLPQTDCFWPTVNVRIDVGKLGAYANVPSLQKANDLCVMQERADCQHGKRPIAGSWRSAAACVAYLGIAIKPTP